VRVLIQVAQPTRRSALSLFGDGPPDMMQDPQELAALIGSKSLEVDRSYGAHVVSTPGDRPGAGLIQAASATGILLRHSGPLSRSTVSAGYEMLKMPLLAAVDTIAGSRDTAVVIRGELDPLEELSVNGATVRVFSDPPVRSLDICWDDEPVGDHTYVRTQMRLDELHERGWTGEGVDVAIVDAGICLDLVRADGWSPAIDLARSAVRSGSNQQPFEAKRDSRRPDVQHGAMCASAVGLAAPNSTLLDIAALVPVPPEDDDPGTSPVDAMLSDVIALYADLAIEREQDSDRRSRPLIASNSWGIENPSVDIAPTGSDGHYRDGPSHPFRNLVQRLTGLGVDLVFAAGNVGDPCPRSGIDPWPPDEPRICGANSYPEVLSVGGVDIGSKRVGYSLARSRGNRARQTRRHGLYALPRLRRRRDEGHVWGRTACGGRHRHVPHHSRSGRGTALGPVRCTSPKRSPGGQCWLRHGIRPWHHRHRSCHQPVPLNPYS
jgi:hypothetical protein